ncbi:MAG TPA: rhomboid family intramembrane serine protease [Kofleriaceae bacterium]|nr:rhomboid family intramembrane serine protease [Kofleriaceae bacterium]
MDWSQLRITRGALMILGIQVALSLIWLMGNGELRVDIAEWVVASPSQVFEHYKVWTLVTSPLLEMGFLQLLLTGLMMWMLVPTLERFWGTPRFLRFVAITSVAGTIAGCLVGWAIGSDVAITGFSPMIIGAVVAFGVIYARQPVQFFGVLPLSGREFMFGLLAVFALSVLLQGHWEAGAAQGAAALAAAIMTSKRLSPGLAWKRWRIARARARLSVLEGGAKAAKPKPKSDEQRWLN